MKNNAVIKLVGSQQADGQTERAELVTEGYYSYTGSGCLLTYEESEITGLEGTTTTLVTEGDEAVLTRSGTNHSKLVFKLGQRFDGHYDTPFGGFTVGVVANRIKTELNEKGGLIDIEYFLDLNAAPISTNRIELSVSCTE